MKGQTQMDRQMDRHMGVQQAGRQAGRAGCDSSAQQITLAHLSQLNIISAVEQQVFTITKCLL